MAIPSSPPLTIVADLPIATAALPALIALLPSEIPAAAV
jgi:hypothetical protein